MTNLRQKWCVAAWGLALSLCLVLPARALAPPSALSGDAARTKNPEAQAGEKHDHYPADKMHRFLDYLEEMRRLASGVADTEGFVMDRRDGFVRLRSTRFPDRVLLRLEPWAADFLRTHGLSSLAMPMQGHYLPIVEAAMHGQSRDVPAGKFSRRGLLRWGGRAGMALYGATTPSGGMLLRLARGLLPSRQTTLARTAPLPRQEQLRFRFAIDAILGRAARHQPSFIGTGGTAAARLRITLEERDKDKYIELFADKLDQLAFLGIETHAPLLEYLRDAIVYSSYAPEVRHHLMRRFSRHFPEAAMPAQAMELIRALPPPQGSIVRQRMRPGLWLDLEHAEYEALMWRARAQGDLPEFGDMAYRLERILTASTQFASRHTDGWPSLWEIMPDLIRAAGGLTPREAGHLHRIARLYASHAPALRPEGRSEYLREARQAEQAIHRALAQADLRTRRVARHEEEDDDDAPDTDTFRNASGETFAQVYERHRTEGNLMETLLSEEEQETFNDPRTWKIHPQEDLELVASLSRGSLTQLGAALRDAFGTGPGWEEFDAMPRGPVPDFLFLRAFADRLGDKRDYAHDVRLVGHRSHHVWRLLSEPERFKQDNLQKLRQTLAVVNLQRAAVRELIRRWVHPQQLDRQEDILIARAAGGRVIAVTRREATAAWTPEEVLTMRLRAARELEAGL